MKINRTDLESDSCPYCQTKLNAACSTIGASPAPGDLTICAYCRNYLEFDEELKLIKITLEKLEEVEPNQIASIKKALTKYFSQG